jgi:hypothetical protein
VMAAAAAAVAVAGSSSSSSSSSFDNKGRDIHHKPKLCTALTAADAQGTAVRTSAYQPRM